jgi:TldD protein
MNRRDFIKVTARGSAFALASPVLLNLLAGGKAYSEEFLALDDPGVEAGMARVLKAALANGGQHADIYLEEILKTGVSLVDGKVESVDYGVYRGGGVRLLYDWKTGYAYCDSWDENDLFGVAGVASKLARGGEAVKVTDLTARKGRGVTRYEISPDEVEAGKKVEAVELADRVARAYDPAIKQVKVTYTDEMKRVLICNSRGVLVRQEIPLIWISIDALAERDGRWAPGYVRRSAKRGFEYVTPGFIEETAREAARQAVVMLDAREAPRGDIPVIIGTGGGVVFHEAVGHGLEADGIEKGTSFFTGRVGEKVGSGLVTIVEDGSMPNMRGSFDFDDEGTPSQRNVLIENGVLKGYIYDLLTAWRLKAQPTGNGRRQSYQHYPLVRMTNTLLMPGDSAPEEIIEATPTGMLATHLGGGEVDTTTGNFTFGVREAYLIENGKITAPVKGATLIGNGPEILGRIDMVGDDLSFWPGTCGKGQWVPVTSGAPTLRIASITVGGRA